MLEKAKRRSKVKRKLVSLLLAVCMIIPSVPVMAEEYVEDEATEVIFEDEVSEAVIWDEVSEDVM